MSKLFFDTDLTGHHSEYISHLIDYLVNNNSLGHFTFIVHPDFSKKFPLIISKAEQVENIRIIEIDHKEHTKINKGILLIRSINKYKLMDKYAKRFSATHVCLLYFNIFQFALGLFNPAYEISGILFLQFYRMQKISVKDKLKYLQKDLQTRFYTRNKRIKKVFVLNDQKTVNFLNKRYDTVIFDLLPDPIPVHAPLPDFNIHNEYLIDKNRKIFLHIGSLYKEKGTIDILKAFNYLEAKDIDLVALLMIGQADPATDALIRSKIAILNQKIKNVVIIYENEFISNSKMKSLFNQCDIVMLPYKQVETSSGILGHAMAVGKQVIGTNQGLLGEIIKENKMGILINKSTPELIALGMKEAITNNQLRYENKYYLQEHTKEKFAEIIFGAMNAN